MSKYSFKPILASFACLLLTVNALYAQKPAAFIAATPESQGVSSAGINDFLDATAKSKNEFHSIMILRHGKVIAQGWWNPYRADLRHTLYSVSKSFTSTAIGFAVSEKRLKLSDKVISFFPNSLPDTVKPYLADMTVKDLITMSAGQSPDPTGRIPFTTDDWVKGFLATPILDKPGSKFLYNSMATFMASAIVQKVTGQKELDYLKPRLFDPLGIKGEDWEVNKQGINTGGWGLRLKTEDLAKLGQLYLQKGSWKEKQLLPKAWIEEATTFKIDNAPGVAQSKKDSSDWMQGYCYYFWRCRHNGFRADGAFGQYIIVLPEQDAVIAITSETANMQDELNLVWKHLLPAMHSKTLPANKAGADKLKQHLASLSLPPLSGVFKPSTAFNKTFELGKNDLNIKSLSFTSDGDILHLTLKTDAGSYPFSLTTDKWMAAQTALPGPGLIAGAREDFSILQPYKVECSYSWTEANTLQLALRYIESPHGETITCHFDDQKLDAEVQYSFTYGTRKIALHGEAAK